MVIQSVTLLRSPTMSNIEFAEVAFESEELDDDEDGSAGPIGSSGAAGNGKAGFARAFLWRGRTS